MVQAGLAVRGWLPDSTWSVAGDRSEHSLNEKRPPWFLCWIPARFLQMSAGMRS